MVALNYIINWIGTAGGHSWPPGCPKTKRPGLVLEVVALTELLLKLPVGY